MGEIHESCVFVCSLTDKIHQNQTVLTGHPITHEIAKKTSHVPFSGVGVTGQYCDIVLDTSVPRRRPINRIQPYGGQGLIAHSWPLVAKFDL
jgi:hypothetical protein